MEFVFEQLTARPSLVLLGGSALLAAGLSILLGVAVHTLRTRRADGRSRRRAPEPAAPEMARVDVVDSPPAPVPAPAPAVDLEAIDARLEDVELHLERLQARIDALVRSTHARVAARPAPPAGAPTAAGSEEERALREMVARGDA